KFGAVLMPLRPWQVAQILDLASPAAASAAHVESIEVANMATAARTRIRKFMIPPDEDLRRAQSGEKASRPSNLINAPREAMNGPPHAPHRILLESRQSMM